MTALAKRTRADTNTALLIVLDVCLAKRQCENVANRARGTAGVAR